MCCLNLDAPLRIKETKSFDNPLTTITDVDRLLNVETQTKRVKFICRTYKESIDIVNLLIRHRISFRVNNQPDKTVHVSNIQTDPEVLKLYFPDVIWDITHKLYSHTPVKHGLCRYGKGCRCDICKSARSIANKKRVRKSRAKPLSRIV